MKPSHSITEGKLLELPLNVSYSKPYFPMDRLSGCPRSSFSTPTSLAIHLEDNPNTLTVSSRRRQEKIALQHLRMSYGPFHTDRNICDNPSAFHGPFRIRLALI